ncbi:MAG: FapA family protein [Oscillospiraceae bacterium]|nr:FapA family protein [Oscillospiraceae bacterium]
MNKNMKYFSGSDFSEISKSAASYFSCDEAALYIFTVSEGTEESERLMLAIHTPDNPGEKNFDGGFNLFYEEDGVYFELYHAKGRGLPLEPEAVRAHVMRKAISRLDAQKLSDTLTAGFGRVVIGPAQEENILNEDVQLSVSKDEMEATIRFLPPEARGGKISLGEIQERIKAADIKFGMSSLKLGEALKEKDYGKEYSIAFGVAPENGVDGSLTYHFDKDSKSVKPIEDENGKVDYRDLDLFEEVKKGQLLISRKPPTQGKAGSTVTGKELKQKAGKDAPMPKTKNVMINEDSTGAYADMNGFVKIADGVVTVSDVFTVQGDCDMSVGNIDFDGSIVITGTVITGMSIKATKNISVGGVVNDAELIAGGDIELKRGIQGADKGKVIAGGAITASFIERAEIKAETDVKADVVLHSKIEAGRSLIITGKRGNIMGGRARVGREVRAKTIGGVSHVQTEIEVGIMPEKISRLKFLKTELERIAAEDEKINQLEAYLVKTDNLPDEKRAAIEKSVTETRGRNTQLSEKYSDECNELEAEAERAVDGKVHCTMTVYPGTKISLGKASYRVDDEIKYATFKYREGNVIFGSCEVSL